MKQVLLIAAVIAMMTTVSLATPTLVVWTQLVQLSDYTYVGPNSVIWDRSTPDTELQTYTPGPGMPLGYYGVQVWAEVLGGSNTGGISDLSVTLYTPDTTNSFEPWQNVSGTSDYVRNDLSSDWDFVPPKLGHFTNAAVYNPGTDNDLIQLSAGLTTKIDAWCRPAASPGDGSLAID